MHQANWFRDARSAQWKHRQFLEASEIPVCRKQLVYPVFEAHRGNLCVEGQVAANPGRFAGSVEHASEAGRGSQQANGGTHHQLLEKLQCIVQGAWWIEDSKVRHHPDKLCKRLPNTPF
jgi:hypothetical protein